MRASLHLLSFFLPAVVLTWLLTGPHSAGASLLFVALIPALIALDMISPAERRDPVSSLPPTAFDAVLAALTLLHLAVLLALPWHVARTGLSVDAVASIFLAGNASGQAFVLAHELIHRRAARFRLPGRVLLAGMLYEHFYTEHLRGHHKHVATSADAASARFGERFWPFFVRTVPDQLRSAWGIESRRVGAAGPVDRRQLHNRVLHGAVAGWAWAVAVALAFGPLGLLAHLGQAAIGVVLLEGVNYIEHWGLRRAQKRVQPCDSWDADGALTYYMLIGLARHGDHHAHAARPWQDLRLFDETPKLPWGYLATTYAAIFADGLLRPRLEAELRRRRLGPYRDGAIDHDGDARGALRGLANAGAVP